jgi:hypothetical protein
MMVPMMDTVARPISRNMVSLREEKNFHREVTKLPESLFNGVLLKKSVFGVREKYKPEPA